MRAPIRWMGRPGDPTLLADQAATSAPKPPRLTASCTMTSGWSCDRGEDRFFVERHQRARIDDLDRDALLLEISRTCSARCTIICVATTVTSFPARLMSALPRDDVSPSGTSPFVGYSASCARGRCRLSSRMAAARRPLAHRAWTGDDNEAGTWQNHASRLCGSGAARRIPTLRAADHQRTVAFRPACTDLRGLVHDLVHGHRDEIQI